MVKEWVHSYTELREAQKEQERQEREPKEAPATKEKATAKTGKATYAERLELKKIDRELPKLEARKEELLKEMAEKSADHHAVMELSIKLETLARQLDEMGDRWLELMEKA